MPIKERLHEFISIVKPETLLRLNRQMKKKKWTYDNSPRNPGRPRKGKETEEIIIKLAMENTWGYGKIQGEMKKLGYHVSISYVRDVLKKRGIPPSDNRKGMTWKQFILSHMDVLWATDFFTEEIWTRLGLTTYYVLFFIHLGTRRVYFAGCTTHPNYAWVSQQSRNFSMQLDDIPETSCKYIIHDRDTCFYAMDAVLKVENIEIIKTPPKSPICNSYAERFVKEARGTLDNLVLFGSKHLIHVLKKIEKYHNEYRPHQGIGNTIPLKYNYPDEPVSMENINCKEILSGLLNHYYVDKKAA